MTILCELDLLWAGAKAPEPCVGHAVVHTLFVNGSLRAACFDCLRVMLTVVDGISNHEGLKIGIVAFHPLRDACVAESPRWKDRSCA